MITCSIPMYRKVEIDGEKSYSVFAIEISAYGTKSMVEKRYSEFEQLHRKMKYVAGVASFPPKSVLKFNHRVLESRRIALETYLRSLLRDDQTPKAVLDFLNIQPQSHVKFDSTSLEGTDEESASLNYHQMAIAFPENAYLQETSRGGLPDIVSIGVLQSLYGSADDLH